MTPNDLYIFGTGGHARDLAELAAACGHVPVFVARNAHEANRALATDRIVIEDEALFHYDLTAAIGIGDNAARERAAVDLAGRARFPTLVHPDATLGRGLREILEEAQGTMIFAGVRTSGNVRIGSFCTLNLNATVSHDGLLEDFVNLSPGAVVTGNVHIQRGAWIGAGVVVNQGADDAPRVIGSRARIGSGAVVTSDCEANGTYVGVPAKKIA